MSDLKPEDSKKGKRKRIKKLCADIRQQVNNIFLKTHTSPKQNDLFS